jgi:hypothetical protein
MEILHCLVSTKITQNIPSISVSKKDFRIPNNIRLADEEFNVSRPIELLRGAEIFRQYYALARSKRKVPPRFFRKRYSGGLLEVQVIFQNSDNDRHKNLLCNINVNVLSVLYKQVEKFWLLEGYNDNSKMH